MKKNVIAVFLVLMIMFLVTSLNLQADKGKFDKDMKGEGKPMVGGHHDWAPFLDLDEDVLKKMEEMRLKNKEEMLDLRTKIEKKELEMERVLLEDELDFKKILSVHDEISALRQKISRKRIEHKIEMYKLLPDDKKEKARGMFLHRFLDGKHGAPGMHNCKDVPRPFMGE